jgi:hypothetical protein
MSRLRAVTAPESAPNLDTQHSAVLGCTDPVLLAAFWSAALGYVTHPSQPNILVDPAGVGPSIRFQQSRPSAARDDRPLLDLEVTGSGPFVRQQALVEAEVARLVALGATPVGRATGDGYGVVLADPAGHAFSVS